MPRKTRAGLQAPPARSLASMRPRPDAAENSASSPFATTSDAASMRPRPDAAENSRWRDRRRTSSPSFNEAAARCRGKLARTCGRSSGPSCFNEAAARCRGKHGVARRLPPVAGASMRPRPDAAENSSSRTIHMPRTFRFNEAAARCRGKRGRHVTPKRPATGCFNEAAARCRGKLYNVTLKASGALAASMRPRPDAAENALIGRHRYRPQFASMRPRPDAAENGR